MGEEGQVVLAKNNTKKKKFLQKTFEEHRANGELKEDVVWRGGEGEHIHLSSSSFPQSFGVQHE